MGKMMETTTKEDTKEKERAYLDILIYGDTIFKSILFAVILIGLTTANLGELIKLYNVIVGKTLYLMIVLISSMILLLAILYFLEYPQSLPHRKYMRWLKNISMLPDYRNILEHILGAGIIIHILWVLIISIMLIYRYLPDSNITSFCLSALLWLISVHMGGIFLAPRWEKTWVRKISNIVGLIGLLVTFFISTITMEPFQNILQNVRIEWLNQLFALLFISSQR